MVEILLIIAIACVVVFVLLGIFAAVLIGSAMQLDLHDMDYNYDD